jgi:hypothetical protein
LFISHILHWFGQYDPLDQALVVCLTGFWYTATYHILRRLPRSGA